ncbi:hypothetical protein [Stenotrophomonas sp.]|uniref:hypothetical protein n=1 Tax=Stenotrophomonas sp. TaxID=69392 RepID=UPI0028AC99DB|nr:hypothetical protein [Stenotrophomonas sp.]
MPSAPDEQVLAAISKTGFVLEHDVVTALQQAGWRTINGSYYIDDVSEQARELDIIAYKIFRSEEIDVLTCALVSCKKDSTKTAAFLSRQRPRTDPNADWEPLHWASRVQPMKAHLSSSNWKNRYFEELRGATRKMLTANRDIFAFQMVCADGKPHNDKPYYDSVTGLIKALDHEANKKRESKSPVKKRLYQFSLHAVLDAPMVDVQFQDNGQRVRQIDRITCFSRYMVRKQDTAASVHFTSKGNLSDWIQDLNELHAHNSDFFSREFEKSYKAIITSPEVRKYFQEKMEFWLKFDINAAIKRLRLGRKIENLHLSVGGGKLQIEVDVEGTSAIAKLNSDSVLKNEIAKTLRRLARFSGSFAIADLDIPF